MSKKNYDNHNRWRNKTVAFRVSAEEDLQLETLVKLTGLTKQDYIIRRLLCRDVVVQGNPRVYKALRDQLAAVLDLSLIHIFSRIEIPEEGLLLEPNRLYLGRTNEYTATDRYIPMLEGRSSTGRLGLFIHVTAGFGDVGFKGYWTLEIFCVQPIRIYPNVEICQIYYHDIDGEYEPYSSGKYQNNTGIQPSLLYRDFEK